MSIDSVMLSNHLILCFPFPLLPSILSSCESFLMSQLLASAGQSIGASASATLLMHIQGWFPLGLTGLILQFKGLSRKPASWFKSINSSAFSFLYGPTLTTIYDYWKTIALTRQTFVGKVMSLLFNMLSRFVIAFLPRSVFEFHDCKTQTACLQENWRYQRNISWAQ